MPGSDGIELFEKVRASGSSVPVIMLSGVSHIRTVVESMKMGALDFLLKPFDEGVLESTIKDVLERPESTVVRSESRPIVNAGGDGGFITRDPRMLRLRDIIKRVAYTDVPILILGESGVGKEVMARYAHVQSGRKDQPFVKVNCAALPNDLLESELFGYERGAFTGALNDKPGQFELADRGTLLLDEIGEMSPHLQSKLLHVLQDGSFSRLGARKSVHVDARIIASTNINLDDAISTGKFREDLYYRLNVIRIDLPPLRERPEDIPQLCDFYVRKYRDQYKSTLQELPSELLQCFVQCPWPGNIRQLENVIKRILILGDSHQILNELSLASSEASLPLRALQGSEEISLLDVGANAADEAQRNLVLRTLSETGGNRKKAAARLNICYKALLNKLKRWDVDPKREPQAQGAGS
jgi:two-component system response regulator AtoC